MKHSTKLPASEQPIAFTRLTVFAFFLLGPLPPVSAQNAIPNTQSKTESRFETTSREEMLDLIRKAAQERQKNQAEIAALEEDIRASMKRIRENLFEVELFLAQLKDGLVKGTCPNTTNIDNNIADLQAFAEKMSRQCQNLPENANESRQLCIQRIKEIKSEIATLQKSKQQLLYNCTPMPQNKPERSQ